ncbi:MAG: hypothetical protein IPJ34_27890 [Myxococcales bacterium]|nr:hypothetical protein [Myxococcales bacterium]
MRTVRKEQLGARAPPGEKRGFGECGMASLRDLAALAAPMHGGGVLYVDYRTFDEDVGPLHRALAEDAASLLGAVIVERDRLASARPRCAPSRPRSRPASLASTICCGPTAWLRCARRWPRASTPRP